MHRGVVLLGSEQLGMQELRHVRYVHYDSGSGMYTVEFFDSRIAARYRKVVGDTVSMGGCELGEEHASLSRSVATAASFYPVCVEPPPGLAPAQAPVEEPPPGLGSNSASAAPKAHERFDSLLHVIWPRLDPVSHAVVNTMRRVVIIVAAVVAFNTKVTFLGGVGSAVAVAGTLLYSLAKNKFKR